MPMRARNGCSMPAARHFAFSSTRRRCMSQAMWTRLDQAHIVTEQRPLRLDNLLVRIGAQRLQRLFLEGIQRMRRAVLERIVRDEAIGDVLLLLADHLAEFERQR